MIAITYMLEMAPCSVCLRGNREIRQSKYRFMSRNTSGRAFGKLKVIYKILIHPCQEVLVVFATGLVE